jgi:hypothetical protein
VDEKIVATSRFTKHAAADGNGGGVPRLAAMTAVRANGKSHRMLA